MKLDHKRVFGNKWSWFNSDKRVSKSNLTKLEKEVEETRKIAREESDKFHKT